MQYHEIGKAMIRDVLSLMICTCLGFVGTLKYHSSTSQNSDQITEVVSHNLIVNYLLVHSKLTIISTTLKFKSLILKQLNLNY